MQKANLYIKDWLSIHPYTRQQPSDNYFVQLANRLFHICPLKLRKECNLLEMSIG